MNNKIYDLDILVLVFLALVLLVDILQKSTSSIAQSGTRVSIADFGSGQRMNHEYALTIIPDSE